MATDDNPLIIGGIRIVGADAPELLADFGSKQKLAIHTFAGGITTIQQLGRFPKKITFSQTIRGPHAIALARKLDQLTEREGPVTLTWAGFTFTGTVEDVEIDPLYDGEVKYTVHFENVEGDVPQRGSIAPTSQELLQQGLGLAQTQAVTPTSQFSFSPNVSQGVKNLQNSVTQALSNNQNNLANLPTSTAQQLVNQVRSLRQLLEPLMSGTNSQAASAAADLNNTLRQIEFALLLPTPLLRQITVQDPNLFILASQYYKDPAKWRLIANANNLFDTALVGEYILNIPDDPNVTAANPATLL